MFSSDNNSYPLYYHQSSSFANVVPESNNILFEHLHLHHGKTNNYMMPPTYPPISENPMYKLSSQPLINQDHTLNYPLNFINHMSSTRKTAVKKDRHTKISTAQGVRDRRVRLSMSIAREFFNLQDMLGFDKASKTLGWLLTKSKAAIDELAGTTTSNTNIVASISGEEEEDDDYEDANNEKKGLSETSLSTKRKKRETSRLKAHVSDKEAKREKARERARERTRKKKIVDDQNLLKSLNYQLHQRMQQGLMICDSSSAATPNIETPTYAGYSKGVSVEESVVIKGNKSRSSSGSSYNYNYETMLSPKNDQENFNDNNDYINKSSSECCNYGGIMQPPGLFPALNIINLSTEIHINGRPWDTFSNQILH